MSVRALTGTVYVDATGQIAGRLCSKVAKLLLSGKRVVVLNAEKALISGGRFSVRQEWLKRLEIYSHVNPLYGPIHYRRPDNILRRMVRGMVPHQETKGKDGHEAAARLHGRPGDLQGGGAHKVRGHRRRKAAPSIYHDGGGRLADLGWSGS